MVLWKGTYIKTKLPFLSTFKYTFNLITSWNLRKKKFIEITV